MRKPNYKQFDYVWVMCEVNEVFESGDEWRIGVKTLNKNHATYFTAPRDNVRKVNVNIGKKIANNYL